MSISPSTRLLKQKNHRAKPNYKMQDEEEKYDQFYDSYEDTDFYEDANDQTELDLNSYHMKEWAS